MVRDDEAIWMWYGVWLLPVTPFTDIIAEYDVIM